MSGVRGEVVDEQQGILGAEGKGLQRIPGHCTHQTANRNYSDGGIKLLELSQRAHLQFKTQPPTVAQFS
jgi:hypothetical protein